VYPRLDGTFGITPGTGLYLSDLREVETTKPYVSELQQRAELVLKMPARTLGSIPSLTP
jgi:hypothetical protein